MKKVVIVAYYWPPSGGGGVQRWVKFAKYLPQFGWEPIVVVPENPVYPLTDESLATDTQGVKVIKLPIWEPYGLYAKFSGDKSNAASLGFLDDKKEKQKPGFKKRLAAWVRGNLFIPDAKRFWIKPTAKFLRRYMQEEGIEHVITTGPPHSIHLIGLKLKRRMSVKWLADFRDPWVNMDNLEKFQFSSYAINKHRKLEKQVLKTADEVFTVSWYMSGQYEGVSGREIGVITNGYDEDDFKALGSGKEPGGKFIMGHYGIFGEDRNPEALWKTLKAACDANPEFKSRLIIELVGPTDAFIFDRIKAHGLEENLQYIPYLEHAECIEKMKSASVLMVILNQNANEEGRVTGKIFEYLAANRPILGIGSVTSDCARVIQDAKAGEMLAFEDQEAMKRYLDSLFGASGEASAEADIVKYSRRKLTEQLVERLEKTK